jgi:hypothetical protein
MTQKKPTYSIVSYQQIPTDKLDPHPEALIPIDSGDSASIDDSVAENGYVIQPLLVTERTYDGHHLIVDGVNRWKAAKASTLIDVPCLLIRCSDPRAVVAECLATGRKRTTGQRIMVYLEANKDAVLSAYAINLGKGEIYRKSSNASREALASHKGANQYSIESISEHLHCSREDVRAGVELLIAQTATEVPSTLSDHHKDLDMAKYRKSAADKRLEVLSGSIGIRRWAPAVAGKATNGGKGKADARYDQLSRSAAVTLKNVFDQWGEIKWKPPYKISEQDPEFIDEKRMAEEAIEAMIKHIPGVFDHMIHAHIVQAWSSSKRAKLIRELESKARQEKAQ